VRVFDLHQSSQDRREVIHIALWAVAME